MGVQDMSEGKSDKMPAWALPAFSWLVSFYFLFGFVSNVGFPPDRKLLLGDALYVSLWLLFLFLPFFSKIKIGTFLELEREITKTKEELREFKAELRNTVGVLSTNVNTIGGMTNHVTVNLPGLRELEEASAELQKNAPTDLQREASDVQETISLQSDDPILALVKTRIEIEGLLRKELGRSRSQTSLSNGTRRYFGISQLFQQFAAENPEFEYLAKPLHYVTQICNAAIHAQYVSDAQASEALVLGAQIIAALSERVREPA